MSARVDARDPLNVIAVLGERLNVRQPEYEKYNNYYEGDQPISFVAQELREELGRRLETLVINWPGLICNTIAERMVPQGFVIPGQKRLTMRVNSIWQRNNMDEQSAQGIIDKLVYGRCYGIVWGDEDGRATISIESPQQMIAHRDPATKRWTAAIKRWVEDDGHAYGIVYTPYNITWVKSKTKNADTSDLYGTADRVVDLSHVPNNGWVVEDQINNPLRELNVVPIPNSPRLLSPEGISELADVIPLADGINKLATDMMVSSEFFSQPRRWATGVDITEKEDGELHDDISNKRTGRWHLLESEAAKVGQFEEADLQNFVTGVDMLSKYLSAVKKIPAHYMDPAQSGLASAEAVRAAEAPLVVKAKREQTPTGGALEAIARLALMVETGDLPSASEMRMETQWADAENLTQAQRVDAAVKRAALQVPREQLWRDAGYTDQQIEDMRLMLAAEASTTQQEQGKEDEDDDAAA